MHYKTIVSAVAIHCVMISGAYAEDLSATQFVQKASVSNFFEIESSKLARERSESTAVKDFADAMITDHTKAGQDLKAAVKKSGMDDKAIAKALDEKHQEKLAALQKKEKKDFDDAYIEMQEDAHEDAVELFSDYAQKGTDAELKAFASKTLPVLQKHKAHVEKLD